MNETNPQNNNLKDQILKKIKSGEVAMRPRAYFVAKVLLVSFVVFITFITSALLISYILFSIKAQGGIFLLSFGTRGFYEFILVFPWILLLINIFLLIVLDLLLKHFKFCYNRPLLYVFLISLTTITVFGSLVNYTSFHQAMMSRAESQKLPMFGGFYKGLRGSHKNQGIFRGEVASTSVGSFTLKRNIYDDDLEDLPIQVFVPNGLDVSLMLRVGDQVFIAGDIVEGDIHAYGITIVNQ